MRRVTAIFLGAASIAALAEPAAAQLTAPFPDVPTVRSTFADIGYDPKHDAYLVVGSVGTTGLTTQGRFIDAASHSALAQFLVLSANSVTCSTAYSSDLGDGVGGVGAFLVACYTSAGIITEVVAYPDRVVGSPVTAIPPFIPLLSLGERIAMAYSPVDRVFLIAWPDNTTKAVRVDLTGQPVGSIMSLSASAGGPCNDSNPWTCYDIHVVWNPKTAEFGVLEIDGVSTPFLSLVRVAGNGAVLGHTDLIGLGPGTKAIDVNPTTGSYVAAWSPAGSCCTPGVMNRAEIDGTGAILSTGMINGIASSDFLSALVYSPISGSFLLVGHSAPLGTDQAFVELDGHGVPKALPIIAAAPGQFPRATARTTAPEWFINYPSPNGTGHFVRTASCAPPDPFAAFGGGTCVNGGWYPPTTPSPSPTPTPTPSPGGCTTPDPFTAFGGGTCVNGGWFPPTTPPAPTPTPTPTPTPSPGGCTTPDPFTAFGGGACVNGGWFPPGATPPPPVPGGCTTPDPFVALGGGICINGGWYPPGGDEQFEGS